jgi:hypothetical protein
MLRDRLVRIVDRVTGESVGGLIRPVRLSDAMLWTRWHEWMPADAEDAHWEWDHFIHIGVALPQQYPVFALEAGGELQGLMLLEVALPRVADQGFHVSRLSTAPWNRPPESRLRGVGSVFLGDASLRSLASGHDGRIYLSSLPQAEAFYQRIGMRELQGRDPEGLLQFAWDPDAAWAHIVSLERDGLIDAGS